MNRTISYSITADYDSIYAFLRQKKYPKATVAYLRSHLEATRGERQPQLLMEASACRQ